VINQVRGMLRSVGEESATLAVDPIVIEVLIPEFVRRRLQHRLDEPVTLHTVFEIEGNQMSGRMRPRLIGFLTPVDREFFEVFCSVDGVGVRKALRAMVRPVRDIAGLIHDKDTKTLATFPGIGEATADRMVAKLHRKVGKYALIVPAEGEAASKAAAAEGNGEPEAVEQEVVRDAFQAMLSVGHPEGQARELLDQVLATKRRFKSVDELLMAVYQRQQQHERS